MTVQQYQIASSVFSIEIEGRSKVANEIFRNRNFRFFGRYESENKDFIEYMRNKCDFLPSMIESEVKSVINGVNGLSRIFPCVRIAKISSFDYAVRKGRIYLRKVHRIAPVFDYERAKHNLINLQKFVLKSNFFARLTTLLATAIFITDQIECRKINKLPLIQKRLCLLCGCSAYAFHQFRRRLRIHKLLEFDVLSSRDIS